MQIEDPHLGLKMAAKSQLEGFQVLTPSTEVLDGWKRSRMNI
jgi:hypothetical protein